jgi:hypothetical protein
MDIIDIVSSQAAVAFPVHDGAGAIRAIVGIAYKDDRELTQSELDALNVAASSLPAE